MKNISLESLKEVNACKEGIDGFIEVAGESWLGTIIEFIDLLSSSWEYRKWLLFNIKNPLIEKEVHRAFQLSCGERVLICCPNLESDYKRILRKTSPCRAIDFSLLAIEEAEDKKAEEDLQIETLKDFIINGVPIKYLHKGR